MSRSQEKKQLLRSCEPCRISKIRCMPDEVSESKCQRCERLGKPCVYSEAKSRIKRNAASNARRVQDLERKIDRLSSLLQEAPSHTEDPIGSSSASGPLSFNVAALNAGESVAQLGAQLTPPQSIAGSRQPLPIDVIAKGWITRSQAEELVQAFHQDFGRYSPFVVIPSISLERWRMERPSLLLAILVTSSRKDFTTQQNLEREFKTYICDQVIMEGQRNLELLQGLLVYIKWYYYRFRVMDKQLYMFVHLMVAMSLDIDLLDKAKGTVEESDETLETKRTLLGVYYVSSCTCLAQRRPIVMKNSPVFWDCARSLATAKKTTLDPHLIHYISLQSLLEEIAESFGYTNEEGSRLLAISSAASIDSRVSAFRNRLEQVRISIPPDTSMSSSMIFTCDSVAVYLYEVALHMPATPATTSISEQDLSIQSQALSTRSRLLWECLNATKNLFERCLQLPRADTLAHSGLEKGNVAHGAIILIKLAFSKIPGIDGFPLRESCNVSCYFDKLCAKFDALSVTSVFAEHQDSFRQFNNVAQLIKLWYERMEASPENLDELQSMNPLQLADIAKETSFLDFDWRGFDAFAEGNIWSSIWV